MMARIYNKKNELATSFPGMLSVSSPIPDAILIPSHCTSAGGAYYRSTVLVIVGHGHCSIFSG